MIFNRTKNQRINGPLWTTELILMYIHAAKPT